MGQEVSVLCPVCKRKNATYKDVFEAEGSWPTKLNMPFPDNERVQEIIREVINESYIQRQEEDFRLPPFEQFLGPDCLKYIYKENPDYKENISYWLFYSCDDCIDIGDPNRRDKFYEHNPDGVTIWHSQLP